MSSVLLNILLTVTPLLTGDTMTIPLQDGWTSTQTAPWQSRVDRRQLLAMRHPWVPSEEKGYALYSTTLQIPDNWTEAIQLSFYCSDDYHTDDWRPDGSWLTANGFIGHRFKRLLINGDVVWQSDVADPVIPGESPRYTIPLDVKAGQSIQLGLLVYDSVSSTTVLPEDFHQSPQHPNRMDDPDAAKFFTTVYWGDLTLLHKGATPNEKQRPIVNIVKKQHTERWPHPSFGDNWDNYPVPLTLSTAAPLPKAGFPVRAGIPIPAGQSKDLDSIRLQTPRKGALYSDKAILSQWPDQSIRWVQFDFHATSSTTQVDMAHSKDHAQPQHKSTIESSEGLVAQRSGSLRYFTRQGTSSGLLQWQGKAILDDFRISLTTQGEHFEGICASPEILDEGPMRSTAFQSGTFELLDKQSGTFHLESTLFADTPYLRYQFRWFNDTDRPITIEGLRMEWEQDAPIKDITLPQGKSSAPFRLRQTTHNTHTLNGTETNSTSPPYVQWDKLTLVPRHFRERHPAAMGAEGNQLYLEWISAWDEPITFHPGEAVTFECWLAVNCTDPDALAQAVHQPPTLIHPEYFCATGALGPAATIETLPELQAQLTQLYGNRSWEDMGHHYGVRHFPDAPHSGGLPNWKNNYYERALGLWSAWWMTGEREWFDRAETVSQHLLDRAIIHAPVPGQDWLGALRGPGENHIAPPWNPTLRIAGLDAYHKVTGNDMAAVAVEGVLDFIQRTRAGIGGSSVRQYAGPFDSICTAYFDTGEINLLAAGGQRVEAALNEVDFRRGTWQDEHGSRVYRGNIPWMNAQIARPLYWWYLMTGDPMAAQLLVGLAESMACENMDWDTPGALYGYSHNPRFPITPSYDLLTAPVFFAAYEITQDPFFLDTGRAVYIRWLESDRPVAVMDTFWNTPWLSWYIKAYGLENPATLIPEETHPQEED